jgi:hypothetical protein
MTIPNAAVGIIDFFSVFVLAASDGPLIFDSVVFSSSILPSELLPLAPLDRFLGSSSPHGRS